MCVILHILTLFAHSEASARYAHKACPIFAPNRMARRRRTKSPTGTKVTACLNIIRMVTFATDKQRYVAHSNHFPPPLTAVGPFPTRKRIDITCEPHTKKYGGQAHRILSAFHHRNAAFVKCTTDLIGNRPARQYSIKS